MNPSSLGKKLLEWRVKRALTQEQVGEMLRGVTAPTVGRWEKGQEIPGPVQICLEWLVEGKVPFQDMSVPKTIRDEVLKVSMDLGAWEKLDGLRIAGGYASVTDMIGSWIQEELHQQTSAPPQEGTPPDPLPDWRTGPGGMGGVEGRRVAEASPPYLSGATADEAAVAAAKAWLKENPPEADAAAEPEAPGSGAGSAGGKKASRKRPGSEAGSE